MANYLKIIAITLTLYYAFDLCKALPTFTEKIKPAEYGPEKALARDLLAHYAKVGDPLNGRPVERANQTVAIKVGISLLSIVDVNEQATPPSLTMHCLIEHHWHDPFLKWDRSDYEGISAIPVFVKDIWTPDTGFSSSRGNINLFDERSKATIYSDGDIYWAPARVLTADCYPGDNKDTFDCSVQYQSWTTSGKEVLLQYKSATLDQSIYLENLNWDIVNTAAQKAERYYPCCEDVPYILLTFHLELKRKRQISFSSSLAAAFKNFVSN